MTSEDWDTTNFVPPSNSPSGSSQVDRILDSIPGIIDAWRRPPAPSGTVYYPPGGSPIAAGVDQSLILLLVIGGLIWAVS